MALELLEAFGRTVEGGLGWRFLLSRRYRETVRARWRRSSNLEVIADVLNISLGFIFINLIVAGLIWWAIKGT
jgi:hypothetical protein